MNIHSKDLKQLYNQLKAGAKKRNIPFNLSMMDLNELTFPLTCPVLGIPLAFNSERPEDNSFSVDRIDSSKGYIEGNVQWVYKPINSMKNDMSHDDFIELCSIISRHCPYEQLYQKGNTNLKESLRNQ